MMKPLMTLDDEQRKVLEQWVRSRAVRVRWQERALIVLATTKPASEGVIAVELGTTRQRVARWQQRFDARGIEALKKDRPRGGRPARITPAKIQQMARGRPVVELMTQIIPKHAKQ